MADEDNAKEEEDDAVTRGRQCLFVVDYYYALLYNIYNY